MLIPYSYGLLADIKDILPLLSLYELAEYKQDIPIIRQGFFFKSGDLSVRNKLMTLGFLAVLGLGSGVCFAQDYQYQYFAKDKDKENKVVLPDIVIGEMDRLKKHPEVGYEAREFMNYLFSIVKDNTIVNQGIDIPLTSDGSVKGGKFFITNK